MLIVALITLRVTANPSRVAGFPKRRDELLAFAFKVVAAFALVAWASARWAFLIVERTRKFWCYY